MSLSCPTPIPRPPPKSSPTPPLAVPASAALRSVSRSPSAKRKDWFGESISAAAAASLKVGNGLDQPLQMGPVITQASRERVVSLIGQGCQRWRQTIVDGRSVLEDGRLICRPHGARRLCPQPARSWKPRSSAPCCQWFTPNSVEEAVQLIERSAYGNASSIFTSSGAAARKFRNCSLDGQCGREHRRPRAYGLLPVLRLEGQLLRRDACARPRCHRVLHRQKSHCGALAA
jgi:hypothetical protein